MSTRDTSSIDDIARTLEPIKRQRGLVRVFLADKNTAEIAGCAQKLKQSIDSFLVRNVISVHHLSGFLSIFNRWKLQ